MATLTSIAVNFGSNVSIPFSISDSLGRLSGLRVTLAVGAGLSQSRLLSKASALGSNGPDVVFSQNTPTLLTGTVALLPTDYALLPPGDYRMSLWVDDGANFQQCVTPGGSIALTVRADIPRT